MRESTDRVQSALYSDDPNEQLVASRLLENPSAFITWESEHSGLMLEVANPSFRRTQAALLKKATFRLIHSKALFEYLRDEQVRGDVRRRIIAHFHPAHDYTRAVIAEHGLYLRKACSFLCTSHVGSNVVRDPGFFDPMTCYQELYTEYFQIFCATYFGTGSADTQAQTLLMPLLKHRLEQCRIAIMNPQSGTEWLKREAELRQPIGDTAKLPQLGRFQPRS
ncbi:MAG TPA: hypothetical protein VGI90_16730 [Steroidobacteraceae bacterium]|jgi:hypothetical protein